MPSTSKETGRSSLTKRTPRRCLSKSPWWVLIGPYWPLNCTRRLSHAVCNSYGFEYFGKDSLLTFGAFLSSFSSCRVPLGYLLAPQFLVSTLLLWPVMFLLVSAYRTNLWHCSLFTHLGLWHSSTFYIQCIRLFESQDLAHLSRFPVFPALSSTKLPSYIPILQAVTTFPACLYKTTQQSTTFVTTFEGKQLFYSS